jgi:hypothetical protein
MPAWERLGISKAHYYRLRKKGELSAPKKAAAAPIADPKPAAITPVEYGGLQAAYDHFNAQLFASALPDVFFTYQRRSHSLGHFVGNRYSSRGGNGRRASEVSLNPDGFVSRTDEDICSTLVHEQVHVWQALKGTAPKRAYHNKEWAAKMKFARAPAVH